jgi:hypothetical protein
MSKSLSSLSVNVWRHTSGNDTFPGAGKDALAHSHLALSFSLCSNSVVSDLLFTGYYFKVGFASGGINVYT